MGANWDKEWTTGDELKFILGIGGHADFSMKFSRDPSQEQLTREVLERKHKLLASYIRSLVRRTNWGKVDPAKVEKFAQRELKNISKKLR